MTGPFGDVRVLEVSRGQAARMAGISEAEYAKQYLELRRRKKMGDYQQ